MSFVETAKADGAEVFLGGHRVRQDTGGCYVEPTIFNNVTNDMTIAQEEIFGPMLSVIAVDSEEEAIALANDVEYGLAASVWTKDGSKALRVSHAIETGMVWVNCWMHRDLRVPFGGVKASGLGHEGGEHSMNFYSEVKNICLKFK